MNTTVLEFLFKALTNEEHLYTGIEIKRYLKTFIPDLNKNSSVQSGRWNAYCHYSQRASLKNILDKYELQNQHVAIHPLTPDFLVQEIKAKNPVLRTFDIAKDTWSLTPGQCKRMLNTSKPALLVLYLRNGLYQDITKVLEICNIAGVKTLIIVDSPHINQDLTDVWKTHIRGSLIWNSGDSFMDDQLNQSLSGKLATRNWYISWHHEDRTRSILEYHLESSFNEYVKLLAAWYYLLIHKRNKINYQFAKHKTLFKFALPETFTSNQEAEETIQEQYQKIQQLAVPDIFFQIQSQFPIDYPQTWSNNIAHTQFQWQKQSRKLYDEVSKTLPSRPEGSTEIPSYHFNQVYLEYFWYSTEPSFWQNQIPLSQHKSLFPNMELLEQTEDARFIHQYLMTAPTTM